MLLLLELTGASVASRVVTRVDLAGVAPVWWLVLVVQAGLAGVAATGELAAAGRIPVGAPLGPHISRILLGGLGCTVATVAAARIKRKKSRVRLVDITGGVRVVSSRELRFGNFIVTGLEHLIQVQGVALPPATSGTVHFIRVGVMPEYSSSEIENKVKHCWQTNMDVREL